MRSGVNRENLPTLRPSDIMAPATMMPEGVEQEAVIAGGQAILDAIETMTPRGVESPAEQRHSVVRPVCRPAQNGSIMGIASANVPIVSTAFAWSRYRRGKPRITPQTVRFGGFRFGLTVV